MSDRGRWILAACCLSLAFAALVLPPIAMGLGGTSEAFDQDRFHLPTIRTLADQLPRPDLVNLQSATAPGYHLLMAALARGGVDGERGLRLASSGLSLAMLLVVWAVAARRAGPWAGGLLTLPVLCSSYVLGGAIWLTTDNAALLFVLLAIAGGLGMAGPRMLAAAGLAAGLAVCTRQIHAWAAIVPAVGLLVAVAADRWPAAWPGRQPWSRWTGAERIAVVAAVGLPLALVGLLVSLWGGLVPPSLADYHQQGLRWAQPVLTLSLLGGFGVFFAPVLVRPGRLTARGPLLVAAVAAIAAAIPPTAYDPEAGRWGGAIWELARRLPAPADRSVVFIAAAGAGGWLLAHAWSRLAALGRRGDAVMLAATIAGWTAAHCFNAQTWQRYAEPIVLVWLAWAAAIVLASAGGGRLAGAETEAERASVCPRWWWAGPAALAAVQAGLLVVTMVRPLLAAA